MTDENTLILSDAQEAEIATEFGDGTRFEVGQTVLHNHKTGTFRATPSSKKEV